jgi:septum formation protein
MALILASASPRRQELLRAAGIEFTVRAAELAEVPQPGESPQKFAERMAREKAQMVFQKGVKPGDCVLGADTVVIVDDLLLGKPADRADAARMLRLLSGRSHLVTTGVCLVKAGGGAPGKVGQTEFSGGLEDVRSETTQVWMEKLSEQEIKAYVASGEPMDKAGAYAIQGNASRWISRIQGCYFNVVGLPVLLVYRMLREAGVCV